MGARIVRLMLQSSEQGKARERCDSTGKWNGRSVLPWRAQLRSPSKQNSTCHNWRAFLNPSALVVVPIPLHGFFSQFLRVKTSIDQTQWNPGLGFRCTTNLLPRTCWTAYHLIEVPGVDFIIYDGPSSITGSRSKPKLQAPSSFKIYRVRKPGLRNSARWTVAMVDETFSEDVDHRRSLGNAGNLLHLQIEHSR